MSYSVEEIRHLFGGRLVGNLQMRLYVCEAVSNLPDEVIEYVTKNVWFLSSLDDAWGYTFTGNDLKDKHLIVLSEELFRQHKSQIQYTIIHEIGHVMLGHKNSISIKQTQSEINTQERAADQFVKKYLG